ncbi:MAG: hypothetical protein AVDCRST_MAG49-4398, partial [uncultured Thermomicrobiales bacterium]
WGSAAAAAPSRGGTGRRCPPATHGPGARKNRLGGRWAAHSMVLLG